MKLKWDNTIQNAIEKKDGWNVRIMQIFIREIGKMEMQTHPQIVSIANAISSMGLQRCECMWKLFRSLTSLTSIVMAFNCVQSHFQKLSKDIDTHIWPHEWPKKEKIFYILKKIVSRHSRFTNIWKALTRAVLKGNEFVQYDEHCLLRMRVLLLQILIESWG